MTTLFTSRLSTRHLHCSDASSSHSISRNRAPCRTVAPGCPRSAPGSDASAEGVYSGRTCTR